MIGYQQKFHEIQSNGNRIVGTQSLSLLTHKHTKPTISGQPNYIFVYNYTW